MIRPSSTAQEKVPFSLTSAHGSETRCCDYRTRCLRECFGTSLESGWKNLRRGCNSWKRKWVSSASAGTADATTNADRCGESSTNSRVNVVDLRVGSKPETFAGETHEWKGWSLKMRQYIAAVDEELYLKLVNVEANPLREMPLVGMNEPQKRRARQLALMLTMHTKDRALQMMTKQSDPANGFQIWRRFLEEWEDGTEGC